MRENLSSGLTNITGADQPVHPRRLISAFVIRFLESIVSNLATGEISTFYLVSVAEETCLNIVLSETRRHVCRVEAHYYEPTHVKLNLTILHPLCTG